MSDTGDGIRREQDRLREQTARLLRMSRLCRQKQSDGHLERQLEKLAGEDEPRDEETETGVQN